MLLHCYYTAMLLLLCYYKVVSMCVLEEITKGEMTKGVSKCVLEEITKGEMTKGVCKCVLEEMYLPAGRGAPPI